MTQKISLCNLYDTTKNKIIQVKLFYFLIFYYIIWHIYENIMKDNQSITVLEQVGDDINNGITIETEKGKVLIYGDTSISAKNAKDIDALIKSLEDAKNYLIDFNNNKKIVKPQKS